LAAGPIVKILLPLATLLHAFGHSIFHSSGNSRSLNTLGHFAILNFKITVEEIIVLCKFEKKYRTKKRKITV
jgi:hypothetical protein